MPWCPACDRFLSPSTVRVDGSCPSCGRPVDRPADANGNPEQEKLPPLPWHFWLLMAAVALYLGWRAWQGVEWLLGKV